MILYGMISLVMIFIILLAYRRSALSGNVDTLPSKDQATERTVFWGCLLFFWVLTAFRDITIGNDTITYCRYFTSICNYGINESYFIEVGFQKILAFIGKFTNDPHVFLIIFSSILYFPIGIIIYKKSSDLLIATFFTYFFCFGCFCSMLRQGLAMVICFYAYIQLKDNKRYRFIALVLLASCIHTSAFCVLLLILHKYIPKSNKFILGVVVTTLALSSTSFFLSVSNFFGGAYSGYFESKYAGSGYLGTVLSLIRGVLILLVIKDDKENKKDAYYSLSYTNAMFIVFFLCCGFTVNLIGRISDYFVLFSILDLTYTFSNKKEKRSLFVFLFSYIILLNNLVLIFRPEWNHLYPYEFWHK